MSGPAHLLSPVIKAHQFLVFTVPSSLQRAVAHGLNNESDYYLGLGRSLQAKRAYLEPRLQVRRPGSLLGWKAIYMMCLL